MAVFTQTPSSTFRCPKCGFIKTKSANFRFIRNKPPICPKCGKVMELIAESE